MGKRKPKIEDQTDQSSNQENKGETKPLIVVSDKPKNMPEEKSLKESEKHLTPPLITNVPEIAAHQSWGPANRRKR
jgi:hypothetical protein